MDNVVLKIAAIAFIVSAPVMLVLLGWYVRQWRPEWWRLLGTDVRGIVEAWARVTAWLFASWVVFRGGLVAIWFVLAMLGHPLVGATAAAVGFALSVTIFPVALESARGLIGAFSLLMKSVGRFVPGGGDEDEANAVQEISALQETFEILRNSRFKFEIVFMGLAFLHAGTCIVLGIPEEGAAVLLGLVVVLLAGLVVQALIYHFILHVPEGLPGRNIIMVVERYYEGLRVLRSTSWWVGALTIGVFILGAVQFAHYGSPYGGVAHAAMYTTLHNANAALYANILVLVLAVVALMLIVVAWKASKGGRMWTVVMAGGAAIFLVGVISVMNWMSPRSEGPLITVYDRQGDPVEAPVHMKVQEAGTGAHKGVPVMPTERVSPDSFDYSTPEGRRAARESLRKK